MSNPADNTEGCEVCGLDRQVLGCRPGKCKNEEAPPLGYTKCPTPGCPRWMGPNRLKCWSEVPGGNSGVIYPDWEPPAPAAPEHPLPWRWTDHNGDALLDGDGGVMLVLAHAGPVAPYVRAVTERAGALDRALRWAMSWLDDFVDFDDHESEQRMKATAARKLLAEIDAAKAGG